MRKGTLALLTLALMLTAWTTVWAGGFDDYNDFKNTDGTYSYYFLNEDVFVTMNQQWYQNTMVVVEDAGATFYHTDSYKAYEKEGLDGGRLFTLGASVNTSFQELPSYVYLGFDEDTAMHYYAQMPTDYQAYMDDDTIRAAYDVLWAGVEDVIGSFRPGNAHTFSSAGTEGADSSASDPSSVYLPDVEEPQIIKSGDYAYTVNDDAETVTICEYNGTENEVEIPAELDGCRVAEIGPQVFSYATMSRVTLPDGLTRIGARAFEYCDELTEVTIPAGMIVGPNAFGYCEGLTKVLVGENAVIGANAFGYCDRLETVVCADGSKLEPDTFEYCRGLKKVILCGNVTVGEDAFYDCDEMVMTEEEASAFADWKETPSEMPLPGGLDGGWQVREDLSITEEAQAAFDKAVKDSEQKAVALLGTQVVAGINYCFLCRTGMTPSYQLVYIYENLQGDAEVLEEKEYTLGLSGSEDDKPLPEGEHHISLTGELDVFVECPTSAAAGEIVTVKTVAVEDGEVKLEVNGEDIGSWHGWGTYSFVMPDEDVEICGWISTEGYPGA